jgi:hypothetical protein
MKNNRFLEKIDLNGKDLMADTDFIYETDEKTIDDDNGIN